MKLLKLATALALTVLAGGAEARRHSSYHAHSYHRAYSHSYGGGYYTNVNGHHVHRPMVATSRPTGATARCGDGSWSFSENHRGTCSHHGGVSAWL